MPERELHNLIALWIDGRITEQDSAVLQRALLESADARSLLRGYAHLDAALHEVAEVAELGDATTVADALDKTLAAGPAAATGSGVLWARATPSPATAAAHRRYGFNSWVGWVAACAAGAAIAVSLLNVTESLQIAADVPEGAAGEREVAATAADETFRKPPAPVATLTFAEAARWDHDAPVVGQTLLEGETIQLTQGRAQIGVGYGAEIVAEAPASLTFLTHDRVQLNHGRVIVDVAPWAEGFTVVTDNMDVVDLGTTFTVSAAPGKQSEAAVVKGMIRVHPSKNIEGEQRGVLITEGQQVSSDGSAITRGLHDPEVARLLRNLKFDATERYRPVDLHNTGYGLSVGDEDRHWKVASTRGAKEKKWRFASVCVPHESYLPNAPGTSQWVSIEGWETADANTTYTFQTVFDLRDYNLDTMQLFGRFLADNGVASVRVNGKSVPVRSWVDNTKRQPFGIPQFRFVNVTKGLVEGVNTVEIDVRNGMQRTWVDGMSKVQLKAIPNPMALRVEWYAFGRQASLARISELLSAPAPPSLAHADSGRRRVVDRRM